MTYDKKSTAHVKIPVKSNYGEVYKEALTVKRHELTDGTKVYCASVPGFEAGWYESEKEAIEELAKWLERTADALFDFVAKNYRPAIAHVSSERKIKVQKMCATCSHYTPYHWCTVTDRPEIISDTVCDDWEPKENCEGVD